ncbi:DUF3000 domain-containing protein [Demequina capsici]|uniref:DUF3000 domain-containing protein n=1 Tax=Demequina capsici TaxID=3075620 RepID=A0AA96F9M3_9MICO|nr:MULTISPECIES: DUF3000 domain-containing protein [unclassified Demequina]WNM25718.1 DUF3000 domain-containing protein [Demequina sp. OYTSA14]WNM28613.1 DUF3000 domain-containing protein [Demequina sp. PMTSA13]
MAPDRATAPPAFLEALRSIAGAQVRGDVRVAETTAPSRIAPFAAAIDGEVTAPEVEATGRFVLLHDPDGNDAWDGTFRVVALVKALADAEVGADDIWADVAWSRLEEALEGVPHRQRGGTVTKVVSRSYGELAERPDEVRIELRASWTPETSVIGPHITAWTELMASCAGLPPVPEGVTLLRGTRA